MGMTIAQSFAMGLMIGVGLFLAVERNGMLYQWLDKWNRRAPAWRTAPRQRSRR